MDEYINRESIYKTLSMENPFGWNNDDLAELFRQANPADVAPVRHGRWERVIPSKSAAKWSTKVSCSNCHSAGYTRYKYCPNCGCLILQIKEYMSAEDIGDLVVGHAERLRKEAEKERGETK